MKIVTKLYLFSGIVIGIFCLLLFLAAYQQRRIILEIEQIIERDIEISTSLSLLTMSQLKQSIQLERMAYRVLEQRLFPSIPTFAENITTYIGEENQKFNKLLIDIQSNLDVGTIQVNNRTAQKEFVSLRKGLDKIKELHTQYIDLSIKLFAPITEGRIEDISLYQTTYQSLEDELNHAVESTLFEIQEYTATSVSNIKHLERRALILFTTSGFLLLLVIIFFLTIIIRRIRTSIGMAVHFAENIEAGRRKPPKGIRSKDEIGLIIHAMEFMLRSIKHAEDELKRLALTDSLTGVANRLNFNTTLDKEIERVKRYEQDLSIIMFDIDHFKSFNDTYGHDAGDLILIELAEIINKIIRSTDLFARWGGEEFILLLPNTSLQEAHAVAEKLRSVIEQHPFSGGRKVTSSFGVCQFDKEDADSLLKRVDVALYESKEFGRNRVTVGRT